MGSCQEDADCPDLAWLKTGRVSYEDDGEAGEDYRKQFCDDQSVCIYHVRAVLAPPWTDFTVTDCVHSSFTRKKCMELIDPDHPLTPCLELENKCAATQGINTALDLFCIFYFVCARPTIQVFVP